MILIDFLKTQSKQTNKQKKKMGNNWTLQFCSLFIISRISSETHWNIAKVIIYYGKSNKKAIALGKWNILNHQLFRSEPKAHIFWLQVAIFQIPKKQFLINSPDLWGRIDQRFISFCSCLMSYPYGKGNRTVTDKVKTLSYTYNKK